MMQQYFLFCLTVALLALSPGPNWAYLISRSISQGRKAGVLSLFGTLSAFLFYMVLTAFGLSIIFKTVPVLYLVLKVGGAGYLFWLAWQALKPNGTSMFAKREMKKDSNWKLYQMGLLTNLLNPKTAVFYLAIFPVFLQKNSGSIVGQTILLGLTQIVISLLVNLLVVITAAQISVLLEKNTRWMVFQKWFTGSILAFLGVKMLMDKAR